MINKFLLSSATVATATFSSLHPAVPASDLHADYQCEPDSTNEEAQEQAGEEVEELVCTLQSAEWEERQQAIRDIAKLGAENVNIDYAIPALVTSLRSDPVSGVRASAAMALRHTSDHKPFVLEELLAALEDPDTSVAFQALVSIRGYGAEAHAALPTLLAMLPRAHPQILKAIMRVIAVMGEHAVPELTRLIADHRDPRVRIAAIETLMTLGNASESMASLEYAADNETDADVKKVAIRAVRILRLRLEDELSEE